MKSETFHKISMALASLLVFGQGMYYATVQPGPMDSVNGAIAGIVIYAIWFTREKKAKLTLQQQKMLEEVDNFDSTK